MARINRTRAKRKGRNSTTGESRDTRGGELDWDARYGDIKKYKKQVAIAHKKHQQAHNKCCCCLANKAREMHHTEYTNQEKLGVNWFPLCDKCHHEIAHSPSNWVKSKINPVWNNRNTQEFTKRLQLGFQLLYGGIIW